MKAFAVILLILFGARPVVAAPITLAFSGELFSFHTGSVAVEGTVTWDPENPNGPIADIAYAVDTTLTLNGIEIPVLQSRLFVLDGLIPPGDRDELNLVLYFQPVDLNTESVILHGPPSEFQLSIANGPPNMLTSLSLPADLEFLSLSEGQGAFLFGFADEEFRAPHLADYRTLAGTFDVTITPVAAVPEPTSLLLIGTGFAAAGLRRYRRQL
jgi:hypothetical protein